VPEVQSTKIDWLQVVSWSLFGLLVLFFLMLKSFSFHWQVGDENIYFYMAWAGVDHGALPYADYFFAHPPLHLLPGIFVFGLLGFGPITVRLIPIGATLVGAFFLFLLARRQIGRLGAVATVFLYLTAFSLIRASTHWTGINLSVMWVVIGLWAWQREKPATAGVLMALGVCTGSYVWPAAIMTGMLAILRSKRDGLRFIIGFAVPWAAVQLICLIIGGQSYLQSVYSYHVKKPEASGASWKMSARVFTDNFALFLGALLGPLMAWLDKRLDSEKQELPAQSSKSKPSNSSILSLFWVWWRERLLLDGARGIARIGALWTLGYIIFIGLLPKVYPFYFLLLFPGMALAGGYAFDRFFHHGFKLGTGYKTCTKRWWENLAILGVIGLAVGIGFLARVPLQRSLLPKYVRTHDKPMKWSDGKLPGFVNRALRACCFDDVAKAFTEYGTVQEILYHESRYFEKAQQLADYVRSHSTPEQTIFGDSSTAGLIALLADRRLAADFSDTNTLRFRTGVTPPKEAIKRIDTPELKFIVVGGSLRRDKSGRESARFRRFASLPAFSRFLNDNFQIAFRVADRTKGWFFLLERKPGK